MLYLYVIMLRLWADDIIMCEHIIAHNLHDEKKLDAQSWTDARTTIQAYPYDGELGILSKG